MLLQALEGDLLDRRYGRPRRRIEELLLDRGVDRELLDDAVYDLALSTNARGPASSKRLNSFSTAR
jgi:hypothetical protein